MTYFSPPSAGHRPCQRCSGRGYVRRAALANDLAEGVLTVALVLALLALAAWS